jgi:hypothetical protein
MSEEMVKVDIDTDVERFPCLAIGKFHEWSSPGNDLDIPAAMLARLMDAEAAVRDAERAIMEYVAERYPHRGDVREWLAGNDAEGGGS